MKLKRLIAILSVTAVALSGCTGKDDGGDTDKGDKPVTVLTTPTPSPTPTPIPLTPEELAALEKDREYCTWIQTVLYMAPHSEVDGLFVHMDPESLDYMNSIVGERIELTAQEADKNLFYRYIAFTLDVSSFSELSERLEFKRGSRKIFFTLTYPFDDPRRTMVVEVEDTDIRLE